MPRVHFINVHPGDCSIIEHGSKRVTMIDICDGNAETVDLVKFEESEVAKSAGGNFGMCNKNTNPIEYCKQHNISRIFRFILTHPDMDHMDGFDQLVSTIGIDNFWDSGARKPKPDFTGGPFSEKDWNRYETVRDQKQAGVTVVSPLSGAKMKFANRNEDGTEGGDCLSVLAPTKELLNDPDLSDDVNEGSYVILYRSNGGRVLFCGDAHDKAFDYIKSNHLKEVANVSVLLAPHHGRDSGRSYDFLDFIKPKLTIIGCAPCQHIDYKQWSSRNLPILTSNQAGNIVLDCDANGVIDVYVQNGKFAQSRLGVLPVANADGMYKVQSIISA